MRPIEKLIELKKQEALLKDEIKLAQESAIQYALELGKTGQIATIDGVKVTVKLVSVKPNTPMMQALKEDIEELRGELREKNAEAIVRLESSLKDLTTSEEIQELEKSLDEEIAKNSGEKKPQIAITLPK